MEIVGLAQTDSTNTWVAQHEKELSAPSLVYCEKQTAGRGQRGNSWESAPGKNITASLLFYPGNLEASQQFKISEAIALAIVNFLDEYGVNAKVKWPNDIYVDDKKICGILVEHVVTGKEISRTIAGFGININQKKFISDAPNPVSLIQLTGEEQNLEDCLRNLSKHLEVSINNLEKLNNIHEEFLQKLWRNDGEMYKFYDCKRKEYIKGAIKNVEPEGTLRLLTKEGETRSYSFKEVEFII